MGSSNPTPTWSAHSSTTVLTLLLFVLSVNRSPLLVIQWPKLFMNFVFVSTSEPRDNCLAKIEIECINTSFSAASFDWLSDLTVLSLSTNKGSLLIYASFPLHCCYLLHGRNRVFKLCYVENQFANPLKFKGYHNSTLPWSKFMTLCNYINHSFIVSKPWPIYDTFCQTSHPCRVVTIH